MKFRKCITAFYEEINVNSRKNNNTDYFLNLEVLKMEESTTEEKNNKIFVVGIGSPACDVLNKLGKFKDLPTERIAMDDDPENLLKTNSDRRVFLDWGPRGMGVCSNPVIGEIAAKNASQKIEKVLYDAETIIFVDLLGGRIGTGSLPVIAEIARKNGSRIISILTFPASFEGKIRQNNAVDSILKIKGSFRHNIDNST